MLNFMTNSKYISFHVKPGQGFLFPQEVFWMDKDLVVKRPSQEVYNSIQNSEQIFVGLTLDDTGFKKMRTSDLEIEVSNVPYEALYVGISGSR